MEDSCLLDMAEKTCSKYTIQDSSYIVLKYITQTFFTSIVVVNKALLRGRWVLQLLQLLRFEVTALSELTRKDRWYYSETCVSKPLKGK